MRFRHLAVLGFVASTVALGAAQPAAGQVFSPPCFESGGGRLITEAGDPATFGGSGSNVGTPDTGNQVYVDHNPDNGFHFSSLTTVFVLCDPDGRQAIIAGTGVFDPQEGPDQVVEYRIEVFDRGSGNQEDFYRLSLSNGYDSGLRRVIGNINIMAR